MFSDHASADVSVHVGPCHLIGIISYPPSDVTVDIGQG